MAADLQARLDDLREARATGALRIRHGDVEIEYRSLAEMDRVIASLEAQLGTQRSRNIVVRSSKGW